MGVALRTGGKQGGSGLAELALAPAGVFLGSLVSTASRRRVQGGFPPGAHTVPAEEELGLWDPCCSLGGWALAVEGPGRRMQPSCQVVSATTALRFISAHPHWYLRVLESSICRNWGKGFHGRTRGERPVPPQCPRTRAVFQEHGLILGCTASTRWRSKEGQVQGVQCCLWVISPPHGCSAVHPALTQVTSQARQLGSMGRGDWACAQHLSSLPGTRCLCEENEPSLLPTVAFGK